MHPEYESYKKMGGLLGLFVGWWFFVNISNAALLYETIRDHGHLYRIIGLASVICLQIIMFILLVRHSIYFRVFFVISAVILFLIWFPYSSLNRLIGSNTTSVLSIMYIFCSIRVDVYCGVWKGQ